ncbi:MAG TPA: homoserine dehydrogenase [Candidatus Cloacimonetes bacterium]|nr:homoserine dehydrogenase [Candidatus Cloacimonadota bacterium]HEX37703.1 homoserine dehydrogenase [Candidatus Cloacimonadota bacterium]
MKKPKVMLIGCGTVGQGLLEIIQKKKTDISLIAVSDFKKGSINCADGLDISKVLDLLNNGKSLEEYECGPKCCNGALHKGWDALKTIRECDADIMAEMTFTDIKTGQPATQHIEEALKRGMHVTTSNKGPAALYYNKLKRLADENDVKFLIEGTVMSGTPVFNLARECFAGCDITEVKGILNGTTNYILTKMEQEGWSYQDALKKAQELGYAEADPTADVEGFDALAKVVILSNVLLGGNVKPDDVPCEGISKITLEDIKTAAEDDMRYKLIGSTRREGDSIIASVKPVKLPMTDPLTGVNGANNALTFTTDLLGDVTIQGAGAGKIETGFSIFVDILNIIR